MPPNFYKTAKTVKGREGKSGDRRAIFHLYSNDTARERPPGLHQLAPCLPRVKILQTTFVSFS
jgi:hypothetical protein